MSYLLQPQRIVRSWWFLLGLLTSINFGELSPCEKVDVIGLENHMVQCEATAQQLRYSNITTTC